MFTLIERIIKFTDDGETICEEEREIIDDKENGFVGTARRQRMFRCPSCQRPLDSKEKISTRCPTCSVCCEHCHKIRMDMLEKSMKDFPNVELDTSDGLLVDYAAQKKACSLLRGMRAVSDFEYEFQMALMNRRLNKEIQTVFLMTGLRWIFTSSSIIKEAVRFGGDVSGMVPPLVNMKLKEKFGIKDK